MRNLFRTMLLWGASIVLAFHIPSCDSKCVYEYIDPAYLNGTICMIDSTLSAGAWHSPENTGECEFIGSSKETWGRFVSLCSKDKFREAYDFINDGERFGDLLARLNHSTPRYFFFRDVMSPMMFEFENGDSAQVKYKNLLGLEVMREQTMMRASDTGYVPKVFPLVADELARMLAFKGRVDEALELTDDFAYAVDRIYGNSAYTNFSVTFFLSGIYSNAGQISKARETLENYKGYTMSHQDPERDPKEYDEYISRVDKAIKDMAGSK